jgi:transcriptional antiterminator RfaH
MGAGKGTWFAVVTKPRRERTALENLRRQGFECFLPMAENPYQRRRREPNHRVVEPLFPRYLFLKAKPGEKDLAPVRSTLGVVGLVRFGVKLAAVPDSIIAAIKSRIDPETGLVRILPVPVGQGDRIKVFDGPLAGVEGVVQERVSEKRALILLEILGRRTEVEVDALMLQIAG